MNDYSKALIDELFLISDRVDPKHRASPFTGVLFRSNFHNTVVNVAKRLLRYYSLKYPSFDLGRWGIVESRINQSDLKLDIYNENFNSKTYYLPSYGVYPQGFQEKSPSDCRQFFGFSEETKWIKDLKQSIIGVKYSD